MKPVFAFTLPQRLKTRLLRTSLLSSGLLCASLALTACNTAEPAKPAKPYQPPAGIKVAPPLQEKPAAAPTPSTPQTAPATPPSTLQPAAKPAPLPAPQPKPAPVSSAPAASTLPARAPTASPTPKAPAKPATTPTAQTAAPATVKPAAAAAKTALAAPIPGKPIPEKPASEKTAPEKTAATTTPATPTTPETITVSLDNLPLSIHGQWTLNRNESRCLLQSTPQKMDDGQGGTRVQLLLSPSELTFTTESDIDTSYTGTGIRIDGGTVFPLETVASRTNLAFSRQRSALLSAMKTGQNLELALGFWPTWPITHTYTVTIPLQHFGTAHAAWERCNRLLSQR